MSDHLSALPADAPRGIWGAVMLAVGLDGNIDWSATQETLARLCASGVHGVYSNGTACEFHCQTEAEFDRLSEMVAAVAGAARIPFQIGISQSNPRVACERLKRVGGLGLSGVQFTLPDWWPPSDEEVLRFVSGLAEAAPSTPLVLYNPPHAKRRLALESIAALGTAVPSLVGAKLPGGDASWYAGMRRELSGLSVFVPGHTLATGYANGAHGSYSNIACLSPKGALQWWAQIRAGEQAAFEMQARVQAFLADHVLPFRARYAVSDAALDKAMAAAGSWSSIRAQLLWPYSSVPDEDIPPLATAARVAFPGWF
ncbi:dihydrodipicolinate synthase family protein [Mesorhizobium sp. ESP-6-4]|uniref:dihydrodipicolinate synthase family protein n=1 Tax=Mesorhizobium sp. ESP-6-4 TaxID=2876624 RepID=UPI001CCF02C8|nr:dihydrodipicolinate synthase family protein [Mesorhizobium sp. ESP-6-4]MBZ9661147.1 dihydrodipicolinate synthase family protein [Mesorhizobium sp. ESP-6-4]